MRISVEGAEPETAKLVIVLLHGGDSAAVDFLGLSQEFEADDNTCWLAPQALQRRWYPSDAAHSRVEQEPYLTVSTQSVLGLLQRHAQQTIILAGFEDGAGIVAELLTSADLPASVGAAWIASGRLVGPEEEWPECPKLSLNLLISGSGDQEPTASYFKKAGARVVQHRYNATQPQIDSSEIALAQAIIKETR